MFTERCILLFSEESPDLYLQYVSAMDLGNVELWTVQSGYTDTI